MLELTAYTQKEMEKQCTKASAARELEDAGSIGFILIWVGRFRKCRTSEFGMGKMTVKMPNSSRFQVFLPTRARLRAWKASIRFSAAIESNSTVTVPTQEAAASVTVS